MNQKIEFKLKKSISKLKEETLNYFQNQGFKLAQQNGSSLQFNKGSLARNMMTFNPLRGFICKRLDSRLLDVSFWKIQFWKSKKTATKESFLFIEKEV